MTENLSFTPRSASAVVVGSGVIGASIAFNLARLGMRDILVLEKGTVAGQASGRSGALVRMHYTDEPEASLAHAALPWFENWSDLVGGDCGFVRTGFLQLVDPSDNEKLRRNVAMLRRIGVDTQLIQAAEIAALQPGLMVDGSEQAAFEPGSGYADPVATTRAFVEAARRLGAVVQEGVEVTAIRMAGGRTLGVATTQGVIDAPTVVLANGGWATRLTRPLGLDLPIFPARVQLAVFQRPPSLTRGRTGHLVIIDRSNGFYARPADDDTLIGLSGYHNPLGNLDDYSTMNDPDFVSLARQQVSRRFPAYSAMPYVRGHAGPLDVTADSRAILGRAPGLDGLYLAVGMSGTGFKKSPAIGACIAELITTGEATTAPIKPFRFERFADNDLIVGDEYSLPSDAVDNEQVEFLRGRGLVH